MTTYTTARKSYWPHILTQWAISSVPAFLIVFIASYFITVKEATYWILGGASLLWFGRLIDTSRNYKIVIDENDKTLTQYYRSSLSGEGEKLFTISKMRLYVKTNDASPLSTMNIKALVLYKDHRQVLKLDIKNDGFRSETLHEIRVELEKQGVPVSV